MRAYTVSSIKHLLKVTYFVINSNKTALNSVLLYSLIGCNDYERYKLHRCNRQSFKVWRIMNPSGGRFSLDIVCQCTWFDRKRTFDIWVTRTGRRFTPIHVIQYVSCKLNRKCQTYFIRGTSCSGSTLHVCHIYKVNYNYYKDKILIQGQRFAIVGAPAASKSA